MNEYGYIYKIINDIDDMVYIGQTKNYKERWKRHLWDSKHKQSKLYTHMRLHGTIHFYIIVYKTVIAKNIDVCNRVLNALEREEISKIDINKTLNINCVNKKQTLHIYPAPCREKPAHPARRAAFILQNIRKFYMNSLHFINYFYNI